MYKETAALYIEQKVATSDENYRAKQLNEEIRTTLADAKLYLQAIADCLQNAHDNHNTRSEKFYQSMYDNLHNEICSAEYRFEMGGTLEVHEAKLEKLKEALAKVKQ